MEMILSAIPNLVSLARAVMNPSEDDQRRRRQREIVNICPLRELLLADEETFRAYHSMSMRSFRKLFRILRVRLEHQNSLITGSVPAEMRLHMTLRFLSTGEPFGTLAGIFQLPKQRIKDIVAQTLTAIIKRLKTIYLKIPTTEQQWLNIAHDFEEMWNYPHCLGALDGQHIAFSSKAPTDAGYSNYRQFNSIVLLAMVDANYRFLYVDTLSKGGAEDAFTDSPLFDAMESNWLNIPPKSSLPGMEIELPYVILADQGFHLQPWLMKPYETSEALNMVNMVFNCRHKIAHLVVGSALGIMGSKFRALQTNLKLGEVLQIQKLVMATTILHNFLISEEQMDYLLDLGDWSFLMGLAPVSDRLDDLDNEAHSVRNGFKIYFNSTGALPWQVLN